MPNYGRFLDIAKAWEAEFNRNQRRYGARIHCRQGCTDCCHHLFQITELEAAFISRAVKALPAEERERLRAQARQYLAERQTLLAERAAPDAWGSLPPPGLRLPCPALVDGACRIYSSRPLICRRYGMPLYNPQRPERVFACELNFQPGEEIDDDKLVEIHTNLYEDWREIQREYTRQGGRRDANPITVARAILEDFEQYLPDTPSEEPDDGNPSG
jgi:Fe-S-cluster containining protein